MQSLPADSYVSCGNVTMLPSNAQSDAQAVQVKPFGENVSTADDKHVTDYAENVSCSDQQPLTDDGDNVSSADQQPVTDDGDNVSSADQQSSADDAAMGVGMGEKLLPDETVKRKPKTTPESSHTSILLSDGNILSDETDVDGISLSMMEDFSSSETPCTSSSEKYSENATISEDGVEADFSSTASHRNDEKVVDSKTQEATSTTDNPSTTVDIVSQNVALGNLPENHICDDLGAGGDNQQAAVPDPFSMFVDFQRLSGECKGNISWQDGPSGDNNQQQELLSLLPVAERKRLKKRLRRACWPVNGHIRHTMWRRLCETFHRLEGASVYLEMEKEMFGEDEDILLPDWLQQTHISQANEEPRQYLTAEGLRTVRKILAVISQLSPDITYSPALLPLVTLFLHYMDSPTCFSCVSTLLASKRPLYLTQTKVAFEASKFVLRDLTKKYAKSAYVKLVRTCKNVDAVFDNWLWWIYKDLPFQHMVMATDSYLLEGIKVLYRLVLAILILYTKHSARHEISGNATTNISGFCQRMPVTPARLLKVAFGIRGLSRHRIQKLQVTHESEVTNRESPPRTNVPHVASSVSFSGEPQAHHKVNTKALGFRNTGSFILTADMLATLWGWLPARLSIMQPVLLFTSAEHGTTLRTLYSMSEYSPYTIIVIKTTNDEIFGAFCSGPWYERRSNSRNICYFGTGETFIFTLCPERCKYEWVGILSTDIPMTANMFLAGDNSCLTIGGGNGEAITLDETMERCRTETCDTFKNPPLCSAQDFTCKTVEVFGFQD